MKKPKMIKIEGKIVGQLLGFTHYFCNNDEVHGWIVGFMETCNDLGYIVEYIKNNGEVVYDGKF
jgi:hypothetical protein